MKTRAFSLIEMMCGLSILVIFCVSFMHLWSQYRPSNTQALTVDCIEEALKVYLNHHAVKADSLFVSVGNTSRYTALADSLWQIYSPYSGFYLTVSEQPIACGEVYRVTIESLGSAIFFEGKVCGQVVISQYETNKKLRVFPWIFSL